MHDMRCFKITRIIILIYISFFLINSASFSQPVSDKRGGICFRFDDNQPIDKLRQVDSIFSKYGFNFCMAIISGDLPGDSLYVAYLKQLISKGHELMDQSPSHTTQYFDLSDQKDTSLYIGQPGVHHIAGSRVCLNYSAVDTTVPHNEGLVSIQNNMVISNNPGEFADIGGFIALYFTALDKVCLWFDLQAGNPNDQDTLTIKSFWDEDLDFGNHQNISYHKLTRIDVPMSPEAIQLLGQRTLKILADLKIPRPYTWIQPGGKIPYISADQLKLNLGDYVGYKEAASYDFPTYLCFNEYNPTGVKQFAMQYGEISIEKQTFKWNRDIISDFIAKHYVQIDLSHMYNPLGGWNAMLKRMDSLLYWCSAKNIPVNTHVQWKAILYDYTPNGALNAFPSLNIDLNDNSYPDGYSKIPELISAYSTKDGVPESGGCCFEINKNGQICLVSGLAGLEKGKNSFSIWTKGASGIDAKVKVHYSFPENETSNSILFPADSKDWIKHTDTILIPDSVSYMNITIENITQTPATIKISGMSLTTPGPFIVDFFSNKICDGDTTILTSTSSPQDSIQVLLWDLNGDGKFDEGVEGIVVKHVFNGAGIYNVGLKGITYSGKTKAIYKDVIVSGVKVNFSLSPGCQGELSTFLDQSTLTGDYASEYYWNFGDETSGSNLVNPTHTYNNPGSYLVIHRVRTSAGCVDSLTKPIIIDSSPTVNLTFTGDTIFAEGDSVIAQVQGDFEDVLWSNESTANYIVIKTTGNWWVKGFKNNCVTEKIFSTMVREFGLTPVAMTIFTPNNDGFNDVWKILNLSKVGRCEVEIFDRWGNKVYSSSDYQNDWNGNYHGKSLGNDTYYYFIHTLDGQLYKGALNILK